MKPILGVFDCKENLFEGFNIKHLDKIDVKSYKKDFNILIVFWNNSDKIKGIKQVEIIEKFVKNTPTIIFDKYLDLAEKEVKFLSSHNVRFLEPAINYRKNFEYIPLWIHKKSLIDIPILQSRDIDLFCDSDFNNLFSIFDDYYLKFAKTYIDEFNVVCVNDPSNLSPGNYEIHGIKYNKNSTLENANSIIVPGNNVEYKIGYLSPRVIDYLKFNVLPLLPIEHKYFLGLFGNLVIKNVSDIKYILSNYNTLGYGLFVEFYDNLVKYYPEMLIQNVKKRFREIINEM